MKYALLSLVFLFVAFKVSSLVYYKPHKPVTVTVHQGHVIEVDIDE